MRPPRLRIVSIMAAVAVVALDLGAWPNLFPIETPFSRFVLLGAVPMANVLALVAPIRACRRFFAGFKAFGLGAMILLLTWGWLFPLGLAALAFSAFEPIRRSIGLGDDSAAAYVLASAVLVVPQMAIALLGGVGFAVVSRAPSHSPA